MTEAIMGFHNPEHGFLSNFYTDMDPLVETYQGITIEYPTSEHMYQALKSDKASVRQSIAELTTPGRAKRRGNSIRCRSDWMQVRVSVMEHVLRLKFSQPRLKAMLLATGDAEIVEVNGHNDDFWGTDIFGDGYNWLGILLMKLRDELKR